MLMWKKLARPGKRWSELWIARPLVLAASLLAGGPAWGQLIAPTPLAPTGEISIAAPTYRWTPVTGATWYQLWVSDTTGTVINRWYSAAQVNAGSGECSASPAEVISAGDATWWIRAWNQASGGGVWSGGTAFSFGGSLPAPTPIAPVGSAASATPTYRWSVAGTATWYQLWVNDSTGTVVNAWLTSSQVNASSGQCSFTPTQPIAEGEATWWVRAWNGSTGNGPWSVGGMFEVVPPLGIPIPIAPAGTVTTITPTYSWTVVPGATWYQLWVNDQRGTAINRWYTAAQVNASSGTCFVTPADVLATGNAVWWVRAWSSSSGNGPWSDGRSMLVEPSPLDWATVLEFAPDPAVVTNPAFRSQILATGLPWRVREDASGIEMLLVPSGSFLMGCSPSLDYPCEFDEFPVRLVTLTQPFYLGRYEVTQAQWAAVMGYNPSRFRDLVDSPARPVEQVSWNAILDFEVVTGLRLPTEAEWEFACRAGTDSAFNNGSNDDLLLGALAWYYANAGLQTRPVGQKIANALGFHDMHGNVSEWVSDWYGPDYYAIGPSTDPAGPLAGIYRVLRGGSWYNPYTTYQRSSFRGADAPFAAYDDYGLRVARSP